VNWFGVKVGSGAPKKEENNGGGNAGSAVGRYLNPQLKRAAEPAAALSESEDKKRRKLGFGSFDSW
jgi:hypothetical protein